MRPVEDLFGWSADNLQQEKEDLNDVDIDGERAKHILLWADGVLPVSYQKLRVVRQELKQEKKIRRKKFCDKWYYVKLYQTIKKINQYSPLWRQWLPILHKPCEANKSATTNIHVNLALLEWKQCSLPISLNLHIWRTAQWLWWCQSQMLQPQGHRKGPDTWWSPPTKRKV